MEKEHTTTAQEQYSHLRRKGWRSLARGTIFLAVCIAIGQLIQFLPLPFSNIITGILSVAGSVALWRPMEIFLYDLPELRRKRRGK